MRAVRPLIGPAGRLGCIYRALPGARAAAVLCHSHPLRGGSMYEPLLHRVACALHAAGVSTLRFDSRGVGESEGRFDDGVGEVEDVRAAIDFVAGEHAEVAVVGFSFGAWVGLRAGLGEPRVGRLVGLAAPLDALDFAYLGAPWKPLLLVHGDCDEWGSAATVRARAGGPTRVEIVAGADHFFRGRQDAAAAATVAFLVGAA